MKKIISVILLVTVALISGCSIEKQEDSSKISDVDFTVVEEIDIPEEVKTLIEEKKANPFQVAFMTGENTYIIVGYGQQATGGYSITVDEFYLAGDGLHVNTNLLGPEKDVTIDSNPSCPYIVLKTETMDVDVIFEP